MSIDDKGMTVKSVQTILGSEPHVAVSILQNAGNRCLGQSLFDRNPVEMPADPGIDLCCDHEAAQQEQASCKKSGFAFGLIGLAYCH